MFYNFFVLFRIQFLKIRLYKISALILKDLFGKKSAATADTKCHGNHESTKTRNVAQSRNYPDEENGTVPLHIMHDDLYIYARTT